MKSLKFIGVLLVGLFMPILVNADTAIINDKASLEKCIETSDACQINSNIEIKDIDFTKGTIEIPEGKTLTISGTTKVSSNATIIVNGTIVIKGGAVLDASKMSYGSTSGLIANQTGKLTIEANGTFIGLDYWEQAWKLQGKEEGWSPIEGGHLFYKCAPGAIVKSDDKTYVLTNENWKGAIQEGDEHYTRLTDAIKATGTTKTTIKLLADVHTEQGIILVAKDAKNIIFDLNGKTLDFGSELVGSPSTVTQNIHLEKGNIVTFKNGTMKASSNALIFIQNYSDLTLENVVVDASALADTRKLANSFNNGKVNIIGNTSFIAKNYAFDVYYWTVNRGNPTGYEAGTQVTIDTTGTIKGNIEVSGDKTPSKSTLNIKNVNLEGIIDVAEGYESNIKISGGTFKTDVKSFVEQGYKSSLSNGKYTIAEIFEVLNHAGENGVLTFDKEEAVKGEVVTMTITPNEGYEIESLRIIDKDNNVIEAKDNKFTMPASDVWVSVKFSPIQTTEAPVVDKDNTIGVSDASKTEDVLLDTIAESDKYKDLSVTVEVVVEDIKASKEVEKEFNKALEEDKVENGKIVSYFDISVEVKNTVTDKVEGYLTKLTDEIEFTVALPKLDEVKDGYVRNYYVIKKHGDKVEILEAKVSKDGKYITFATDEFSTYALAYEDVKEEVKEETNTVTPEVPKTENNEKVPQTFDGIGMTLMLATLSVISVLGLYFYFKRELENK